MVEDSSSSKSILLPLVVNGADSESNVDVRNPLDSNQTVHYLWRIFDDTFMRPVFGGRGFVPGEPTQTQI